MTSNAPGVPLTELESSLRTQLRYLHKANGVMNKLGDDVARILEASLPLKGRLRDRFTNELLGFMDDPKTTNDVKAKILEHLIETADRTSEPKQLILDAIVRTLKTFPPTNPAIPNSHLNNETCASLLIQVITKANEDGFDVQDRQSVNAAVASRLESFGNDLNPTLSKIASLARSQMHREVTNVMQAGRQLTTPFQPGYR